MTKLGELLRQKKLKPDEIAERTGMTPSYLEGLINLSTEPLTVKEATLFAHLINMPTDDFIKEIKPSLIKIPPPLKTSFESRLAPK
jgi:transcriptional regulator with XRE-family HTH domain